MTGRLSLPLDQWPAGDRAAWERARSPTNDLIEDGGEAATLRQASVAGYVYAWGALLASLAAAADLDPDEAPEARLSPVRLNRLDAEMRDRGLRPASRRHTRAALYVMGRLLAPHADLEHVRRPGGRSLSRIFPRQARMVEHRDTQEVLARLRDAHSKAMEQSDGPERRRLLRDIALLGVLATRAPRKASLATLRLNTDLRLATDGRYAMRIPPKRSKTERPLEFVLDAEVSHWMGSYLQLSRSGFPGSGATDALWMGMKGPLGPEGISKVAEDWTRGWFGKAYGPHAFRKWLRQSATDRHPHLARDTEVVMGHSPEVALQHYTAARQVAAAQRHASNLAAERRKWASMGLRLIEQDQRRAARTAEESGS